VGVAGKRGEGRRDGPAYAVLAYVFGACAGAALYRRDMLDDVGLLDEDFFIYDDDVDLSFRAQLRGYRCLYVPTAVVYHHGRGAQGLTNARAVYLSRRNTFSVLVKDMPAPLLLLLSPLWAPYHLLGDIRCILARQGRAVLQARADNWRHLGETLAKRRDIQAKRTASLRYFVSVLGGGRAEIAD
jgi:GT2 family glycosyltransferase